MSFQLADYGGATLSVISSRRLEKLGQGLLLTSDLRVALYNLPSSPVKIVKIEN